MVAGSSSFLLPLTCVLRLHDGDSLQTDISDFFSDRLYVRKVQTGEYNLNCDLCSTFDPGFGAPNINGGCFNNVRCGNRRSNSDRDHCRLSHVDGMFGSMNGHTNMKYQAVTHGLIETSYPEPDQVKSDGQYQNLTKELVRALISRLQVHVTIPVFNLVKFVEI